MRRSTDTVRASRRPPADARRPAVGVTIADRQRRVKLDRRWLEGVIRRAVAEIGSPAAEIGVVLVDDAGIADLHEQWLGLPGPTDVITFDLSAPAGAPDGDGVLRGDIVVSTETAARMAPQVGWTSRSELAYYVIHGILHLTGHDDLSPGPRQTMRRRERTLMRLLGLPLPARGPGGVQPAMLRPAPEKRSRR